VDLRKGWEAWKAGPLATHCNSRDFSISMVPASMGVSATAGSEAMYRDINKSRVSQKSSDSDAWNSRDKSHLVLERPEKAGTKRIQ
jgi:hypothetical protein